VGVGLGVTKATVGTGMEAAAPTEDTLVTGASTVFSNVDSFTLVTGDRSCTLSEESFLFD